MKGIRTEIKDIKGNRTEVDIRVNLRFSDDVRVEVCDLFQDICDKLSELTKLNENYGRNRT